MRAMHVFVMLMAALWLYATSAVSGAIFEREIAGWDLGAYSSDKTREFSHCAISTKYKSGVTLLFWVDSDYKWKMGFLNPEWSLTKAGSTPVRYWIDSFESRKGEAVHQNDSLAIIYFPDDLELFNQFRRGNTLTVSTSLGSMKFHLTGTSRALSEVLECVRQNRPAPRMSEAGPNNSTDPAPLAEAKIQAARWLSGLIADGIVNNITVITDNDRYRSGGKNIFRDAVAVWTIGDILGRLSVSGPTEVALDDIANSLTYDDGKSCKGTYASGRIPDEMSVRRAFSSCKSGGNQSTIVYILFRDAENFIYTIAHIGTGKETDSKLLENAADNFSKAAFQVAKN